MTTWQPIRDLAETWEDFAHPELGALAQVWQEQRGKLEEANSYQPYLAKLRREIAIETGIIEGLYTIDRGTTQLLIERGIDEALIPHGATDRNPAAVVAMIRDHEGALDGVFQFVKSERSLSLSYIKQLHQFLTRNQPTTTAMDQFGKIGEVALIRGDWKRTPNNPQRNGETHIYCPPEQVQPQMEQLLTWHHEHIERGIPPEVEAAWLHHRFTQIHPFQDGNGRVARLLASLVFIRAGWFPLVVRRDDRATYIAALETADTGDLRALVDLFSSAQKQAFLSSLRLSEDVFAEGRTLQTILEAARDKLTSKQQTNGPEAAKIVYGYGDKLIDIVESKFVETQTAIASTLQEVMIDRLLKRITIRPGSGAADDMYRQALLTIAANFDYVPFLDGYNHHIEIELPIDFEIKVNIVLSCHEVGYFESGTLVIIGFAARIHEDSLQIQQYETVSREPFEFTYREPEASIVKRFEKWLDNAVNVGVAYWQRQL